MTPCAPSRDARRAKARGRARRTIGHRVGVGVMRQVATNLAEARREALPRRQESYGHNAQRDTDECGAADPLMVNEDTEQNRPDAG